MNIQDKNWWDFPTAVLLLGTIWFAGMRLDTTGWIEHLELVEFLATSGCLLGLLIGKSRLSAGAAKIVGLGYSLVIVPWQLSLAAPLDESFRIRLITVVVRLNNSIYQFLNNQRLDDPIFFLACISILFWSFSLISGYLLARYGRPWYPLLAAAMVVVMIEFYHMAGALGLASGAFAMCLLLLAARLFYLRLKRGWEVKNLSIDNETGFGLGKSALVLSCVIVLAAWNLPLLSPALWSQVEASAPRSLLPESWQERVSKIVAALNQPASPAGTSFARFMGLGREAASGENILFSASILESAAPEARFYWRARAYDFYDRGSWVNTQDQTTSVAAGAQSFLSEKRPGRKPVSVSIQLAPANMQNLFTTGEPTILNLPVQVIGEIMPEGIADVDAVTPADPLPANASYVQTSLVDTPSKTLLRTASQDYPAWVRARDLQLPTGMTQRTKDLAAEITAGLTTPYDRAEAITAWLRREIRYETTIPSPPPDRDIVDWFLFDYKAGFCNYYATAEVMMLRSLGIPARMAAGYAQGQADPTSGAFKVKGKDSHAWPEVYFPAVGWVEFEPTANQPELERKEVDPAETAPNADTNSDEGLQRFNTLNDNVKDGVIQASAAVEQSPETGLSRSMTLLIIGAAAVLLGALLLAYLWYRRKMNGKIVLPAWLRRFVERLNLHRLAWLEFLLRYLRLSGISRAFLLVPVYIRLLGGQTPPGATPAERIRLLNQLEPATGFYGTILLREYEKENFSAHGADLEVGAEAGQRLGSQVITSLWQKLIRW
jgi:transglutaminase-like putative cysteine protease